MLLVVCCCHILAVKGRCHLVFAATGADGADTGDANLCAARSWLLTEQLPGPHIFLTTPPPCPATAKLAAEQPWSAVGCHWASRVFARPACLAPPILAEAVQELAFTGCGIFSTNNNVIMPIVAPIRKLILFIS
jgi:hypothetical protein